MGKLFGGQYFSNSEGVPLVLVSTDLWPNNVCFTRDEQKEEAEDTLLAIFDWQCARRGIYCVWSFEA